MSTVADMNRVDELIDKYERILASLAGDMPVERRLKLKEAMPLIEDAVLAEGRADQVVRLYIVQRDHKKVADDAHKTALAATDAFLARAEAHLNRVMTEQGVDSIKTSNGTAYKTTKTSATVADWTQTLEWIQTNAAWNFLDKKVNKTAVVEHMKLYAATPEDKRGDMTPLPPGVAWREEVAVNVRR